MPLRRRSRRNRRMALEAEVLTSKFPGMQLQTAPVEGAVGYVLSNSGKRYGLWIPTAGFPRSAPSVYIISPDIRQKNGRKLPRYSASMHTLGRNEHGHIELCMQREDHWRPTTTLYFQVMKARLWIEAYEAHLQTGKRLDHYLAHQAA